MAGLLQHATEELKGDAGMMHNVIAVKPWFLYFLLGLLCEGRGLWLQEPPQKEVRTRLLLLLCVVAWIGRAAVPVSPNLTNN